MSFQSLLPAISKETLAAFRKAAPQIIRETVAQAMIYSADIVQHGDQAERLITSGLEFTTRMLDSAMSVGETVLLDDGLLWVKDRLPHDGVSMQYVMKSLIIYRKMVLNNLPPGKSDEVISYIDWMISKLATPGFQPETKSI